MAKKKEIVEMGYTLGQWAGLPHYACKQCPFDTLDLDVMLEHLVQTHSPVVALTEPLRDLEIENPAGPDEIAQGIFEVTLEEVSNAENKLDPQSSAG